LDLEQLFHPRVHIFYVIPLQRTGIQLVFSKLARFLISLWSYYFLGMPLPTDKLLFLFWCVWHHRNNIVCEDGKASGISGLLAELPDVFCCGKSKEL
jgi:hypothetical protein